MPVLAFLVYLAFVGALYFGGRSFSKMPGRHSHLYASGERHVFGAHSVQGYSAFFITALFFAVMHLGVLVVASGTPAPLTAVYIAGLALTLLALILG